MKNVISLILILFIFPTLEARDYKFGKVSKEEVLEEAHSLEKEANAAVLFREHKVYFNYSQNTGFTLITEVHERIKIYKKDGFGWANKEIIYAQNGSDRESVVDIKGSTYNLEDGKLVEDKLKKDGIFDEEMNKYRLKTTLTMPNVKEGSVVEYTYTIRSPFVISIDEVPLQYTIPIDHLEVEVAIPEYLIFRKHFNLRSPIIYPINETRKNASIVIHSSSRSGGRVMTTTTNSEKITYFNNIFSVSKDAIPALKEEAYIDYLKNYAAYIKLELQSTHFPHTTIELFSQTWESVSKSIYNDEGYARELKRSNFFEDDIDQVLTGITSPEEKARTIFNYVRQKVKWNDFYGFLPDNGTKEAYKEGIGNVGDINILLLSMLKYAGLNADPVLLSSQDNGIPVFPTRSGFNYVVAGLQLNDNLLLLDATDPNAAMGELPQRARNWQGRILKGPDQSDWVNLMPKTKSNSRVTLNLQFEEDMSVKGKITDVYNGFYAKSFREDLKGMNEEKYVEELEKDKGNIEIQEIVTENEDKIGEDVIQSYTFNLQDGVEEINDRIYLQPLLFEAMEENPFKAEERIYPIFFGHPAVIEKTVNVLLPEGYEVEALPENFIAELNAGAGSFTYHIAQNGRFLRLKTELDLNIISFAASDYQPLKEFYEIMLEKQNEVVVLKKI